MFNSHLVSRLERRLGIVALVSTLMFAVPSVVLAQEVADDAQELPAGAAQKYDLTGAWTLNDSCYSYTTLQGVVANVSVAPCFTASVRLTFVGNHLHAEVRDNWACGDNGPRLLPPGTESTGELVAYDLALDVAMDADTLRGDHIICEWGTDKKPRAATQHVELSIGQDGNVLTGAWHSSEVDQNIPITLTRYP